MDDLEKILIKKAKGYSEEEVVEEYVDTEDGLKLCKRKIVYKQIPPDLSALKLVLEKNKTGFDGYSDDDLAFEKERLLKELKKGEKTK